MGKLKLDLTKQIFGRLTVVKHIGNGLWLCQCICGNFKEVDGYSLQKGGTQSCGCLRRETSRKNKKDRVGQRFGKLLVIKDTGKRKRGGVIWCCLCDCGNFVEVNAGDLKSGTQSCGCLIKEVIKKLWKTRYGKRMRDKRKQQWKNPKFIEGQRKGRKIKPNKPEKKLDKILSELFLDEYRYVGGFQVIIDGLCPDFINVNGQKKIIELFGDYWHREELTGRDKILEENRKVRRFAEYGYQTLIVWEYELDDIEKLKKKILSFNKEE